MATVRMASSLHAQITRSAISPRLAIRIFLNMKFSFQLSAVSYPTLSSVCGWRTFPLKEHKKARLGAPQQEIPDSLLRPDHKQFLPIFDRLPVDRQFLDDLPSHIRLNLIEQLHGLHNAQDLS